VRKIEFGNVSAPQESQKTGDVSQRYGQQVAPQRDGDVSQLLTGADATTECRCHESGAMAQFRRSVGKIQGPRQDLLQLNGLVASEASPDYQGELRPHVHYPSASE
jgi:hypothetical protein